MVRGALARAQARTDGRVVAAASDTSDRGPAESRISGAWCEALVRTVAAALGLGSGRCRVMPRAANGARTRTKMGVQPRPSLFVPPCVVYLRVLVSLGPRVVLCSISLLRIFFLDVRITRWVSAFFLCLRTYHHRTKKHLDLPSFARRSFHFFSYSVLFAACCSRVYFFFTRPAVILYTTAPHPSSIHSSTIHLTHLTNQPSIHLHSPPCIYITVTAFGLLFLSRC